MHEFDEEIDALAAKILEYSLVRLRKIHHWMAHGLTMSYMEK